jgi:CRISPR-associated protein Csb1
MPDLDLTKLSGINRLLMTVPLRPVQGDRFQPTGFPSLGAASYQGWDDEKDKRRAVPKLLVESAQSMANRLETTCWDAAQNRPVEALNGISHVTVIRGKDKDDKPKFLTDSMLEAHRLNSPYIENCKEDFFTKGLPEAIGVDKAQPIDRKKFLAALLKYDLGCLIHGVFIESLDGRLRIPRALSAFIEASGVQVAPSGGVKIDRIQAGKDEEKSASGGFGNVPFPRDEYVAERINLYVNFDLVQIRGYGFGKEVERLLILLALFKLRKFIDGDMRLRTACDLCLDRDAGISILPTDFTLPSVDQLSGKDRTEGDLQKAITACKDMMVHTTVTFEGQLKKAKAEKKKAQDDQGEGEEEDADTDADV